MTRERKKPRFVLSVAEEGLLLPSAAPHLAAIILAALDTGMRRGEILTQRWEHIDFNRQLLSVTHSKTAEGEAREIPLTGVFSNSSRAPSTGRPRLYLQRPAHPQNQDGVENRHSPRRDSLLPLPRSAARLQLPNDGSRCPARSPQSPDGSFLGRGRAFHVCPCRVADEARRHPQARSMGCNPAKATTARRPP